RLRNALRPGQRIPRALAGRVRARTGAAPLGDARSDRHAGRHRHHPRARDHRHGLDHPLRPGLPARGDERAGVGGGRTFRALRGRPHLLRLRRQAGTRGGMTFSRAQAEAILFEFTKSEPLRLHARAVEEAMQAYARWYGESDAARIELWGMAGLLHDFDYEQNPTEDTHLHVG